MANHFILSITCQNCEDFDRIPQKILVDRLENLIEHLTEQFNKIFIIIHIPQQWLICKNIVIIKNKS